MTVALTAAEDVLTAVRAHCLNEMGRVRSAAVVHATAAAIYAQHGASLTEAVQLATRSDLAARVRSEASRMHQAVSMMVAGATDAQAFDLVTRRWNGQHAL